MPSSLHNAWQTDGPRRWIMGLVGAVALLLAWSVWFVLADVTVYETTSQARVEVDLAAHSVASLMDGQVVSSVLEVGRSVEQDETLVELAADQERLLLAEAQRNLETRHGQVGAYEAEIAAYEAAAEAETQASTLAIQEADALVAEAKATLEFDRGEADRVARLANTAAASQSEKSRTEMRSRVSKAVLDRVQLATIRLEHVRSAQQRDRNAEVATLRRQVGQLKGEIAAQQIVIQRLQHEIDLRRIVAPIAGRIGSCRELRAGTFVRTGAELAAIVPQGETHVVASFPVTAVGRIRPGQVGRLRLHGFPWPQHGMPQVRVTQVGTEAVDGLVTVEMALNSPSIGSIPLQHGLPANAEIQVEAVSPLRLVLRSVGQFLALADAGQPDGRTTAAEGTP